MSLAFRRLSLLALLALLAALVPLARPAYAITRQVTNTNDSGSGSLRQAMLDAQPGDTITFANGAAPWTITPLTPLPELSRGNVTINGGALHNVVIDGGSAMLFGEVNSHGFTITSAGNTISGLVINNFRLGLGNSETTGGAGIYIAGTGATGNRVIGCYIGTDAGGTTAVPNNRWGVLIANGASGNTIGGSNASERNVISGNSRGNITIKSVGVDTPISSNTIIGNYIGTNASGTAAIGGAGNPGIGVTLGSWAQGNTIQGNIIAGHNSSTAGQGYGILSSAQSISPNQNNSIIGNYIGTNAAGTSAIPNRNGISVGGGTNTQIGSAAASPSNVIAGNTVHGIVVENSSTSSTVIAGNWIGLAANGTPLGNGGDGITILNDASTSTVGPKNVISANVGDGVAVENDAGNSHTIKGNMIGTDKDGASSSTALRNGSAGILIEGGTQNTIGGTGPGDGNVIALGKLLNAIKINGSTTSGNAVYANHIGINAAGSAALTLPIPDNSNGILISGGSTGNTIGRPGAGNRISGGYYGIQIQGSGTNGTVVQANQVGVDAGGNSLHGILVVSGPTSATIGGRGAGAGNLLANNGLNGIKVNSASGVTISGTATRGNVSDGIALQSGNGGIAPPANLQVSGNTLTGNAPGCANCTIEVFTSVSGQREDGEGPRYLTSGTTDASGNFTINAAGCDTYLTATATNSGGNTSIFAKPMVGDCQVAQADVQLDPASPSARTVAPGATATYQHTLRNSGTAAGTFTVARSSTQAGWAISVSPTSVELAAGATATISVSVTPPASAAAGASDQTTVTASVGSKSAARVDTTSVEQIYAVDISPDRSGQVQPPGPAIYQHTITNNGNGTDTISLARTSTNPGVTGVTFPDGTSCTLAAGASCERRVSITFAGNATGADTTTVTATSGGSPSASDQVLDTTTILEASVPEISAAAPNPQSIRPGETATFAHTVTNIGNATGTFTVTLPSSAPLGWTYLYTPTASFSLASGASQPVQVTISAATGASAPDVGSSASAQVQVRSSHNALASTSDTAAALLRPAFSLSPASQPTFSDAVPGQTAVFTHTLTNDGNGSDTFTISVTPPGGWAADPIAPITLARNASRQVVVRVRVPDGQPAGSYQADVTAQTASDPKPAAVVRSDTVLVIGAAVPRLSPAQTKEAPATLPTTLTFTHILTNTGNQAGTFSLAAAVQGAPSGWSASVSPPSCSLVQNATCTVTVSVGVPADALVGDQVISVSASSAGPPASSASASDIVRVPAIPGVQLTPSYPSGSGDPGAQVSYIHTLTNTGNGPDTFTVTLEVSPGWSATASPLVVSVPRGATRTVTVTVTVPTGVLAGSTGTVTATATSRIAPNPSASVADTTSINPKAGAEMIPDSMLLGATPTNSLSDTVTFTHTLRNSGSIPLTYALSKSDTQPWASNLAPTEVGPLQPGQTATVVLRIVVPAGTQIGSPSNITTIRVYDKSNQAAPLTTATDTTIVGPKYGALLTPADNYGAVLPGETRIYTHTLTNIGIMTDTFVFETLDYHGWDVDVSPASVELPKGGSSVISVVVQVPTNALSDTLDLATVIARSVSDRESFGSAREHTLVLQVVDGDFSPSSSRAVVPDTAVQFLHTLVNTGNGLDTYVFSATTTLGWDVTVIPPSVTLAPGVSFPSVQVLVQVPPDLPLGAAERVTVKAISQSNPSVAPSVQDLLRYSPGTGTISYELYLPSIRR